MVESSQFFFSTRLVYGIQQSITFLSGWYMVYSGQLFFNQLVYGIQQSIIFLTRLVYGLKQSIKV